MRVENLVISGYDFSGQVLVGDDLLDIDGTYDVYWEDETPHVEKLKVYVGKNVELSEQDLEDIAYQIELSGNAERWSYDRSERLVDYNWNDEY
jgi:hypothetical protein